MVAVVCQWLDTGGSLPPTYRLRAAFLDVSRTWNKYKKQPGDKRNTVTLILCLRPTFAPVSSLRCSDALFFVSEKNPCACVESERNAMDAFFCQLNEFIDLERLRSTP